ncbi:MAG: NTP transferase domain-containing protein [Acidimicrobiales bacterium]
MAELALVILAGGLGSRFGGFKQLTAVGPRGEVIFDYSARDAVAAGFDRFVVVTRSEIEVDVTTHVRTHWPAALDVRIVGQDRDPLARQAAAAGRAKPLGTTHAALVGLRAANTAHVAVVNADDLYGAEPFRLLAAGLRGEGEVRGALVTFPAAKTVIGDEAVTRALCNVNGAGSLVSIEEGTVRGGTWTGMSGRVVRLGGTEPVSMNFWGFAASAAGAFEEATRELLDTDPAGDAEVLLPDMVRSWLTAGEAVPAIAHDGPCIGLTHPNDVAAVRRAVTDEAW